MAAVASCEDTRSPPLDSTKQEVTATPAAEVTPEKQPQVVKSNEQVSSLQEVVNNNNNNEAPPPQVSEETLQHLSRQLEYYFSTVNLSRDTYLRTLRDLNDGYVPATILSSFAKVQQLCTTPLDGYNAVVMAATDFSDYLEVVHVDKETSKRVEQKGPNTLLAIGPKDSKPIELPATPTTFLRPVLSANNLLSSLSPPPPPVTTTPAVQNTIILREVVTGVTEDDIRELFDFEKCPPIKSVVEDMSNYWFVTLATSSRDDMMNVMLALRSKTLKGEPLKARLKSGINPSPVNISKEVYAGDRNLPYNGMAKKQSSSNFGSGKNNKVKGGQTSVPRSPTKDGKKTTGRRSLNGRAAKASSKAPEQPKVQQAPPPPLSHFPSLEQPTAAVVNNNNNDVAKDVVVDEEDDITKPMSSDGASTATTSTSSSVTELLKPKPPVTGYAAALLKTPPPAAPASASSDATMEVKNGKNGGKSHKKNGKSRDAAIPKEVQPVVNLGDDAPKAKVQPVSWGGRRSFADMLKKEDAGQQKQ